MTRSLMLALATVAMTASCAGAQTRAPDQPTKVTTVRIPWPEGKPRPKTLLLAADPRKPLCFATSCAPRRIAPAP